VLNACEKVAPGLRLPLSKEPLSAVTVCAMAPLLVHKTVVPADTVIVLLTNAESMAETLTLLLATVLAALVVGLIVCVV